MTDRIPIGVQLAGVRILIDAYKKGLPINGKDLAHLTPHWEAAHKSLEWLMLNENKIKSALSRETKGAANQR